MPFLASGAARFPLITGRIPGIILALVLAFAATFISDHHGGPTLLYALLLGMSLNSLIEGSSAKAGIDYTSRSILRIGVALLGIRIGFEQIVQLGLNPALILVLAVVVTIIAGVLLAGFFGFNKRFGLLTGGATAICGASAALAISAAMPSSEDSERTTLFAVVAVTTLSTIAMVLYPPVALWLGMSDTEAGFFLGGTIHDVAQVVGAGYSISPEAGDAATVAKLFRVALLIPIALLVTAIFRQAGPAKASTYLPPLFLIGFVFFTGLRSTGLLPDLIISGLSELSRWCLVTAIAAVGLKTSLRDVLKIGHQALFLVVIETFIIAGLIIASVFFLR
ncbi:YeiH family protein [Kiloniella laminariae]|uniref:YeiH family protein n=1 Tax=Kiloniella laminariae TaxID=454162 RepID=UPI000378205A|nr:putative sulfate exporter family transporter [Kiloniella laminariae]